MPKKGKGRGRPKKRPFSELEPTDEQTTTEPKSTDTATVENSVSDVLPPDEKGDVSSSDREDDMESVNLIEVKKSLAADDMDVDTRVIDRSTDDSSTKADDSVVQADDLTEGDDSSYKTDAEDKTPKGAVTKTGDSISKEDDSFPKADDSVSKTDGLSSKADTSASKEDNSTRKTDNSPIRRAVSPSKAKDFYSSKADDPLSSTTVKTTKPFEEPSGFRFIDINLLVNFVSRFPCPACFKPNLGHDDPKEVRVEEKKVGAACVLVFTCGSCGVEQSMTNSARAGPSFEVNSRFHAAMFTIGNNNNKAKRFCSTMKMPEPTPLKPWMNRHT